MSDEQKRDTELLAVSVDPKVDLQKMVDRISKEDGKPPDFLFLSDPGHRVINRCGLLNPDDPRGIPHPTTYVIDQRGVVLLNIWATWCDPCRSEMPSIERLYRELGPKGLKVLALSIDDAGAEGDTENFAREFGLTFEILHDPTGRIQQTYQLIGVPQALVIDKAGVIRKKAFESDWYAAENRELVAKLLETS